MKTKKTRMSKRVLSSVLFLTTAFTLILTAYAQNPQTGGTLEHAPSGEISVLLNGSPLSFDVSPQNLNGRIVVPLRAIFEAMGATIEWNGETSTVTATRGSDIVILTVGDTSPTVNGTVVPLDQAAVIVDGRTLAPLRFVAEAFGGTIVYS